MTDQEIIEFLQGLKTKALRDNIVPEFTEGYLLGINHAIEAIKELK